MLVVDLTVELFEQQPPEIPAYSKVMVILRGLAAFHKSCNYPVPIFGKLCDSGFFNESKGGRLFLEFHSIRL